MPGRKPLSRLRSRYSSASCVASPRSLPLATRAVSAADRVSPEPVKVASNISYLLLPSTDCAVASTLSTNWSGRGMPVTST